MLSALKRLFSKSTPAAPAPSSPAPTPAPPPPSRGESPAVAPAAAAGAGISDGIPVFLKTVVATMPDVLKKRLDRQLTGKEMIQVSRGDALRQLPTGSVKVPFSEIVRQAPNTFLSADQDMLATLVTLPLQEILPHIKTLPRRAAQRQIEVPQDLAPVFGAGSEQSREVKSAAPPTPRTGSRPSPPETSDGPLAIPVPAAKPIPPPPPKPVPPPQPAPIAAAPAAPAKPPEAYVPPPPKPLEEQRPISFNIPKPEAPKPAPAPTPIPATPVSPIVMAPVADAPVAPKPVAPPPAFTPPPPAPAPAAVSAESTLGFGDVFGQPQKLDWTPQEIVEKTATLRGVAGALITTVDGLPVAFHLPANLSGNAVGAFVPQMYTRITQYTRDLKLGDAKHLTILIEDVPLQIFKTGSVYFTALGKAKENLPKPQLTAIAAALGRQSQS